jgi:hypothetical protein
LKSDGERDSIFPTCFARGRTMMGGASKSRGSYFMSSASMRWFRAILLVRKIRGENQ